MGESDYLDDNLMQKPFLGKEKYIFFLYSIESGAHQNANACHDLSSMTNSLLAVALSNPVSHYPDQRKPFSDDFAQCVVGQEIRGG